MPRRKSRSTRSSGHRSSRPRRRKTATRLKLYSAPKGGMPAGARSLSLRVQVGRNKYATERGSAFIACAVLGKDRECSEASSPTVALGRAINKIGTKVADRPTSFAGLGALAGRRRRRRRR